MWDGERSRTDGANFDDSLPASIDAKSANALAHSIVNSNRVQQTQVRRHFTRNVDYLIGQEFLISEIICVFLFSVILKSVSRSVYSLMLLSSPMQIYCRKIIFIPKKKIFGVPRLVSFEH